MSTLDVAFMNNTVGVSRKVVDIYVYPTGATDLYSRFLCGVRMAQFLLFYVHVLLLLALSCMSGYFLGIIIVSGHSFPFLVCLPRT